MEYEEREMFFKAETDTFQGGIQRPLALSKCGLDHSISPSSCPPALQQLQEQEARERFAALSISKKKKFKVLMGQECCGVTLGKTFSLSGKTAVSKPSRLGSTTMNVFHDSRIFRNNETQSNCPYFPIPFPLKTPPFLTHPYFNCLQPFVLQ